MNHLIQFSSVFGVYFCPLGGEGGSRAPEGGLTTSLRSLEVAVVDLATRLMTRVSI